jgi:hypothetical protein
VEQNYITVSKERSESGLQRGRGPETEWRIQWETDGYVKTASSESRNDATLIYGSYICLFCQQCYGNVALTYGAHGEMGNTCILLGNCRRAGFENLCVDG